MKEVVYTKQALLQFEESVKELVITQPPLARQRKKAVKNI